MPEPKKKYLISSCCGAGPSNELDEEGGRCGDCQEPCDYIEEDE